ncbi:UNVERIFIED_CONTAM: GDT1-like protein 5 [Sesamum angustifolium]|uniref:GDT1 family protein n=1 Tax=Sesamum angustifolium TaxID=2727405 RepID=A0AAW2KDP2_9LAMI
MSLSLPQISRKLAHNVTTLLFFVFGLWSLWDAYNEDDDDNDELAQVEKELLATIGLAADEDTVGVILGGILAQAICTIAAVIGGKSLASRVSERLVTLLGGVLFLLFGVQSFFSPVD